MYLYLIVYYLNMNDRMIIWYMLNEYLVFNINFLINSELNLKRCLIKFLMKKDLTYNKT